MGDQRSKLSTSVAPDLAPIGAPTEPWADRGHRLLPGGLIGRAGLPKEVAFMPVRGEGSRLYDDAGRAYVDYLAGAGALMLGHSPPAVVAAIAEQASKASILFGLLNEPALDVAEILVAASPRAEKVAFTTTGSEATQYAMRFARAFTRKSLILKFEGAYHGNHDFVQVSTSTPAETNDARGHVDSLGVPALVLDSVVVAPFNDLEAVRHIVRENLAELAGIMVDAFPRGGVFPMPGFVAGLRRIADEFGILLLFDEVLTGFRLAFGGAQAYFGVAADLVAYGKIIGGGLSLGAVAGPAAILDLADTTVKSAAGHVLVNGTLHGTPLAAAAGLATLRQLRATDPYERINSLTETLRREVAALVARHRLEITVSGAASYWSLSFRSTPPRNLAEANQADYKALVAFDCELVRHGVLSPSRGATADDDGPHGRRRRDHAARRRRRLPSRCRLTRSAPSADGCPHKNGLRFQGVSRPTDCGCD